MSKNNDFLTPTQVSALKYCQAHRPVHSSLSSRFYNREFSRRTVKVLASLGLVEISVDESWKLPGDQGRHHVWTITSFGERLLAALSTKEAHLQASKATLLAKVTP